MHSQFSPKPLSFAVAMALTSATVSFTANAEVNTQQQQVNYNFSIASGSLSATLNKIAKQSGANIAFSPKLAQGKSASEIQGNFTLLKALDSALSGTNLQVKKQANNSYIIVEKATGKIDTLATATVQDASIDALKTSYTADSASSATGLSLSLRETPQSITVMTRQIMDDFALDTVDAVLANTTGININRAETDRAFPTARGFAIEYLQVDGVSSDANGKMNSDLLSDTAIYERIEVVRGAAGILAGAGNPSASINLIRKRPTEDFQAYIKASAGSWSSGRIEGDISGSLTQSGAIRSRLVTAYDTSESYIDFYGNDRTLIYGITEFDLSKSTLATIGIDYQKEDIDGSTYGEPVPFFFDDGTPTNFDTSVTTGAPWTNKQIERTTIFADISHEFSNGWQVKAAASRLEDTLEGYLVYLAGYINAETGAGLRGFTNPLESDRDLSSFNLTADGNFTLFGREHELLVGWSHTIEEISRKGYNSPKLVIDNFFQWPVEYPSYDQTQDYTWGWENKQTGAYATSRWSIAEPITLLLGARLSSWDNNEWDSDLPEDTGYKHSSVLTPYAGLVYDISENFSFYTSYTEIFRPQNNKDRQGNYLDPEDGINIEAGIKGEFFDGKLNSSLAVFHVKKDNVAEEDGAPINGDDQRYKGIEGVKVKGFEAELTGEVFTGFNLNAGYTYRDAEQKDDQGNTVVATTNEPEHMLRINGNYQFSGTLEDLAIGGALRWQSKMYTQRKGPNGEDAVQDAYAVADMMARYQITDNISANLNINNIFDKKHYSSVPVYNAAFYGAPRNVSVSVRASF